MTIRKVFEPEVNIPLEKNVKPYVSSLRLKWLLPALLMLCIGRLWLMPLPSSFWVDEMATAFVVQHGAGDASLAVAPQVPQSIYYAMPRAAEALLGFSEIVYRAPSILAMGIALLLIARLAARLIHPQAAWFAVFACLALRGVSYEAADARPYALGICVAAASLTFLVRWLDSARWRDALLFTLFAALLWRVHLVFWPFYLVLLIYTVVRVAIRETQVTWGRAGLVFALLGLALSPVLMSALALYREAQAHVIVPLPSVRELAYSLKCGLILQCGAGAWLLGILLRWPQRASSPSRASLALLFGWWLAQPLCLFAWSWLTGDSVFVSRYLSLTLPGSALIATASAAYFIPSGSWKPLSAALAIGVLLFLGQWRHLWPPHHNSDWKSAAAKTNELGLAPDTPLICPSPFIEARTPVWQPDYPLPGFLYAHLPVYPVRGKPYLLPFETSPQAEQFAVNLSLQTLAVSERFVLYGGDYTVRFWRDWFANRPELAAWKARGLGPFGDVDVVVFERAARAQGRPAQIRLASSSVLEYSEAVRVFYPLGGFK